LTLGFHRLRAFAVRNSIKAGLTHRRATLNPMDAASMIGCLSGSANPLHVANPPGSDQAPMMDSLEPQGSCEATAEI